MAGVERDRTWEEPASDSSSSCVARLVRVLSYDDLLADDAEVLSWDGDPKELRIGRAPAGKKTGWADGSYGSYL